MDKDLEKMVQRCDTCQLHNKSLPAAPLHPWEWPEKPWTRIHIDYARPFLGKMLLVAVEATSKWIETHIMSSTTSTATVNKLREIFAQHGLPELLVSDNAANLISEEFETFMRKNGIVHVTSAPYHPASNGLGERAVQTVQSGIIKTAGDNMEVKLQRFLFDYRRIPQPTTGKSPMEILNNRKMRSRLGLLHPSLQGKIHKKQKLVKETNDCRAQERHFEAGDSVHIKNFGPGLKWLVGTVGYVTGPVPYTVVLGDGSECRRHVDHVRARHANTCSVVSTTRSNQVDAETAVKERYKAPISVLPSIELDVPTATSNAHAATVLPRMSPAPSTIESDDNITGTSEKAVSGLSPHSTDTLGATTPARKSGRRRLAPAW